MQYREVDANGVPVNDTVYDDYRECEADVRQSWAEGRETYVAQGPAARCPKCGMAAHAADQWCGVTA